MYRKLLRNISSNLIGYIVTVIVAFFLSPFVVHSLGDELYGIWTLVMSLTGYYGLLDMGVRSGVGHYITRYIATDDADAVNRIFNTSLMAMTGVSLFAVIITATLALTLGHWVDMAGSLTEAKTGLLITGFGVAIGFPLAVYSAIPYALERFDIHNAIGIGERLAIAVMTVAVLKAGLGIVGLALITVVCQIFGGIVRLLASKRIYPRLSVLPTKASLSALREIASYGFPAFFISSAERIVNYTDSIVIGIFLPASAITFYTIAGNLIPYYMSLIAAVTLTFTPYATKCDAMGQRLELQNIFLHGTRCIAAASALIGSGLILIGGDFIELWMGPSYVEGDVYESSAVILQVLAVAAFFRAITSTARQVLFGMRKMRITAFLSGAEALSNIVLSIILIRSKGLLGVAFGTLIPVLLFQGIAIPIYLSRQLAVGWTLFFISLIRGILPVSLPMFAMFWLLDCWQHNNSWSMLCLKLIVFSIPALIGFMAVTLSLKERRLVLTRATAILTFR